MSLMQVESFSWSCAGAPAPGHLTPGQCTRLHHCESVLVKHAGGAGAGYRPWTGKVHGGAGGEDGGAGGGCDGHEDGDDGGDVQVPEHKRELPRYTDYTEYGGQQYIDYFHDTGAGAGTGTCGDASTGVDAGAGVDADAGAGGWQPPLLCYSGTDWGVETCDAGAGFHRCFVRYDTSKLGKS